MFLPAIVMVEWEDATALDEGPWVDSDKPLDYEPNIMHTVGFLLLDVPAGVIVTGTVNADLIGPRDQIPRGMIRRITVLREALPA